VTATAGEALEAAIDERQIREDQLEVERLQVTPRIHRSGRVRDGGILEGPDDVQERVRFAEAGEVLGR